MTSQRYLRERIATLERLQARRIKMVEQAKIDLDASVELAQREIDNLKAQVTIS